MVRGIIRKGVHALHLLLAVEPVWLMVLRHIVHIWGRAFPSVSSKAKSVLLVVMGKMAVLH